MRRGLKFNPLVQTGRNMLLNWLQHGIRCAEHLERQGLDGSHGKATMTRGAGWKMHIWTSLADCTANSKWPIQSVPCIDLQIVIPDLVVHDRSYPWVTCCDQLGELASRSIWPCTLESSIFLVNQCNKTSNSLYLLLRNFSPIYDLVEAGTAST
jgi:hypothetical protein